MHKCSIHGKAIIKKPKSCREPSLAGITLCSTCPNFVSKNPVVQLKFEEGKKQKEDNGDIN